MEYILDTLQTHLFIEMVYGGHNGGVIKEQTMPSKDFKLLSESFGVFSGCEELAGEVAVKAWRMKNDGDMISYFKPKSDFIDFVIIAREDGDNCAYETSSKLNDGNKYDPLILRFGDETIDSRNFKARIMHELAHAYEDWARRASGSEGLNGLAKKFGYSKTVQAIRQGNETPGSLQYALNFMFYYFSDFELNAHITSILGDFEMCDETFNSVREALDWIKGLKDYQNYLTLLEYAESFLNLTDKNEQDKILIHASVVSNRKFKTYDQFKKWLRKRVYKVKKRLDTTIPKYVCDKLRISSYIY